MPSLLLFAAAKDIAGSRHAQISGRNLAEVLSNAKLTFGPTFSQLLPHCMVLVDGKQVDLSTPVSDYSEIAILPPVSGGQ